jgi:hypothetical protein
MIPASNFKSIMLILLGGGQSDIRYLKIMEIRETTSTEQLKITPYQNITEYQNLFVFPHFL